MKLLHPTDFSATAKKAHILALDLSQRLAADLDASHVQNKFSDNPAGSFLGSSDYISKDLQARLKEAHQQESTMLRSNLQYFTNATGQPHLLWGQAVPKLLEFSEGYDLVVMGAHGANRLDNFFLGGTAGRLVRRSKVPVLTVRDEAKTTSVKRILVATDFSEASKEAWRWCLSLASKGVNLVLVHIIDDPQLAAESDYVKATTEALSLLADGKAEQQLIREGDPVQLLPKLAQELNADLIAVGLKRRNGALGLLLGSRADKLLRSSPVPILSVPFG